MIIQSVTFRTPSRRIDNAELLDLIREENHDSPSDQVERYCGTVKRLLENIGAQTRYIRDKVREERGFDLLIDAVRACLSNAGLPPSDVDLVIYCGVGRGFLEPANAAFITNAIGMKCDNFDINEACMSWVRSLQIAYSLLATQAYSTVLIVNAEFTTYENGLSDVLRLRSHDQIDHTFPALTIGEAATATILTASDRPWRFRFKSLPRHATLCTLPLPGFDDFCKPDGRLGLNDAHRFVAFGLEMSRIAVREMVAFIRQRNEGLEDAQIWFPHNPGETMIQCVALQLGLSEKLFAGVFRSYGNLISASIPTALALAAKDGRLSRGDRIVFCVASAGMSLALIDGVY